MKYYCENCGSVLDEDDLKEYSEGRPGAYGAPCEETFYVCPECGHVPGAYGAPCEETFYVCPECGHVPAEYDYQDKTCCDCIHKGTDACPYGGEYIKVCGDFLEEEEYKVVDSGKGWTIERLTTKSTNAPDLNEMLRKALRKKRYKWE